MIPVKPGKLKHRVAVQQATQSQDSYGDTSSTWTTLVTRWAAIEPTGGSEQTQAGKQIAGITHRVTIRYYAGLTPKMRILWGTRVLNIESGISTEEDGKDHVLQCREVAS